MKKILKMFFGIIICFSLIGIVKADADYTYRTTKTNKPVVKVGEVNAYVTVSVLSNMEGAHANLRLPVDNVSAKFENNKLYVTVKRSAINKVMKENNFDNVYSLLEVNMDFIDLNPNKKYYIFKQYNSLESNLYSYYTKDEDYLGRMYNILEISSSSLPLVGTNPDYHSVGGGFMLYEADEYSFERDTKLTKEEIVTTDRLLIDIPADTVYVDIVEDEQIDLGNNNTIIDSSGTVNQETGEVELNNTIDVNNFYGEYFENQKLKYSWTVYDKDGNPIELNVNTSIKLDDSENEEKILANFSTEFSDIKERIKIISFEHEGEIGGTAKVSLYVGDKFEAGSILTLYYYNPEKDELENPDWGSYDEYVDNTHDAYEVLVDNDGYITIELTHCSEYVLTMQDVKPIEKEVTDTSIVPEEKEVKKENKYLVPVVCGIVGALLVTGIIVTVVVIKKKKNKGQKEE